MKAWLYSLSKENKVYEENISIYSWFIDFFPAEHLSIKARNETKEYLGVKTLIHLLVSWNKIQAWGRVQIFFPV